MAKRSLEEELDEFLELWGLREMLSFVEDFGEILHLYNVSEEDDWVEKALGEKVHVRDVRIARTIYLISRAAEVYGGRLCRIKAAHPGLWRRMEKAAFDENVKCEKTEERRGADV